MADTLSVLRVVAARSQCEEVEKWGQSASQLPPSQAVGDGIGKRGGSTENGRWKPKQGGGCLPGPQRY